MHRALFLEEIVRVICRHCYLQHPLETLFDRGYHANTKDVAALARTCQVFKSPALDILWGELNDATPLARCLPEVCMLKDSEFGHPIYTFKRQLTEIERETVRSYTRRVRSLTILNAPSLDLRSLEDLCLPAIADPLFPNIRRLSMNITDQTLPLTHHVFPSMLKEIYFYIPFNFSSRGAFSLSLATNCPNVNKIQVSSLSTTLIDPPMIRLIRGCTHLQMVDCLNVGLDIDALSHLSRMPGLTLLAFTLSHKLSSQISTLNNPLTFTVLWSLRLSVASTVSISNLLLRVRLPAITFMHVAFVRASPSKEAIRTFLTTLQEACTNQAAMHLSVSHQGSYIGPALMPRQNSESGRSVLTLEDMHYFAGLNLHGISIDLNWWVDLKDDDLLQIASLCPRLGYFHVNDINGWRGTGITLTGLARFLERCPCLHRFAIALDTHSPPPLPVQTSGRRSTVGHMTVDVLDSPIEEDAVPTMAAFFADLFPSLARDAIFITSWGSFAMHLRENREIYAKRWQDVYTLAKQKALERFPQPAYVMLAKGERRLDQANCLII